MGKKIKWWIGSNENYVGSQKDLQTLKSQLFKKKKNQQQPSITDCTIMVTVV